MTSVEPVMPSRRVAEVRDGIRDILPVLLVAAPIGLLFGSLCAVKGLSALEAGAMSFLVNAGVAQFAALDLWHTPLPALSILVSTLLINLRQSLMSVSLTHKMAGNRRGELLLAFFFLVDPVWALVERRAGDRRITLAYWFAAAVLFTIVWVGSTIAGVVLGRILGDPQRIGVDFAFTALLIAWTVGLRRGRAQDLPILAAGATALAAYLTVGAPWHVLFGALAGLLAAYVQASPGERHVA
jgi:4-azaleucine resistance transporter AzlC